MTFRRLRRFSPELEQVIANRLPPQTKERFLKAVMNHHDRYKDKVNEREYLTVVVIIGDRLALGKEFAGRA